MHTHTEKQRLKRYGSNKIKDTVSMNLESYLPQKTAKGGKGRIPGDRFNVYFHAFPTGIL